MKPKAILDCIVEFKASLRYMRPCLKESNKQKIIRVRVIIKASEKEKPSSVPQKEWWGWRSEN